MTTTDVHLFGMNNMHELYLRTCQVAGIAYDAELDARMFHMSQAEAINILESDYPVRIVGDFDRVYAETFPDLLDGFRCHIVFQSTAQPGCCATVRNLTWGKDAATLCRNLIGSGVWYVKEIVGADVPAVR